MNILHFTREHARIFLGYSNFEALRELGISLKDYFGKKNKDKEEYASFLVVNQNKKLQEDKFVKSLNKEKISVENKKKIDYTVKRNLTKKDISLIKEMRHNGFSIDKIKNELNTSRKKVIDILYDIDKEIIEKILKYKDENGKINTAEASKEMNLPVNLINSLLTKNNKIYHL